MSIRVTSWLCLWLCLAVCATALAQDTLQLAPTAGVLLLRNGNMMQGEITRLGDHYLLTISGGELKIAAKDVEAQCSDIEGVYDWKLRRLSGEGAGPHLDLAEWCLRHNLHRHCAEQLSLALAEEPSNKRIELVDRRLHLALSLPTPTNASASSTAVVSPEQLDKMLTDLPKGALERFTTIVQPMLNNRCATAQCHGNSSHPGLQLMRPPTGIGAPTRFTHRNIYSALQYIDRDDPLSSPLLRVPQEPHGGATLAVFDLRSRNQLHELQTWVEQLSTRPQPPPPEPATIPPTTVQYSSQVRMPPAIAPNTTAAAESVAAAPNEADAPSDDSLPAKETAVPSLRPGYPPSARDPRARLQPKFPAEKNPPASDRTTWKPRDPFDAEIFNRMHGVKR
jgi:hypothetical protein